ncbi:MAG: glycosyltransferase [Marinilabiliales bacterium]|nr:glycosyltransferase [Marinilabiliales bacterium]
MKFRRNYGKSAALSSGFKAAQGDVVITMDADLQDSPEEIPELYRMITSDGLRPGLRLEENAAMTRSPKPSLHVF